MIDRLLSDDSYEAAENATGQGASNPFATISDIKNITVGCVTSESSHTGDLIETVVQSIYVPANTFQAGDLLYFMFTTSADAAVRYASKVYLNTSNNLSGSPVQLMVYDQSGSMVQKMWRDCFILNDTTMNCFQPPNVNTTTMFGNYSGSYAQITGLDFTVDQYLLYTVQLITDDTKIITNRGLILERKRQ